MAGSKRLKAMRGNPAGDWTIADVNHPFVTGSQISKPPLPVAPSKAGG